MPDRTAEIAERDYLLRALAALPHGQRAVLVLRYFDDLSEGQTAEILGCSVGTVKSQTARALGRLRAAVGTVEEINPSDPGHEPRARCVHWRSEQMTDIERRLSIAMHGAIDGEEAAPEELIVTVKRRHRRHLARLSGAAALAVAVVVVAAVALTGKITASDSHPLNNAAASRPKLASTLSGLPMPAGKNFELLITTPNGAGWYSTATHKTKPIGGLPTVLGGYQFDRVNGGWAAFPVSYSAPCDVTVCAGPPTTFYFIAEGSLTRDHGSAPVRRRRSRSRHPATDNVARQLSEDHVTTSLKASSYAQLVSAAGRPLGPRYRLPANYLMQARNRPLPAAQPRSRTITLRRALGSAHEPRTWPASTTSSRKVPSRSSGAVAASAVSSRSRTCRPGRR